MTKQEILEKAIRKAIEGGFNESKIDEVELGATGLVYRHDFAKALWGDELHQETFIVPKELSKRFAGTKDLDIKPVWQYHLQQMVISDDPIKYLGDNLNG